MRMLSFNTGRLLLSVENLVLDVTQTGKSHQNWRTSDVLATIVPNYYAMCMALLGASGQSSYEEIILETG
jgi:hypothetical protein